MRITTTIGLAVVAIVLAIVTYLVEREPSGSGAVAANVLVRFDQEAVDRIAISGRSGDVVLERIADAWFFVAPEQDRASTRLVRELLDAVNYLGIIDRIGGEGESLTVEQTGLEGGEAIELRISGKPEKGKAFDERFVLGIRAPRESALYAARGEEQFVVDGDPRPLLEDPLSNLRELRLLSAPPEAIVQIGITRPTGRLAVQRKLTPPQQNWALVEPIQVWASPDKMDELLADLSNLGISEILGDAPASESIPNPLPEGEAVVQIRVLGIEKPLTLYLREVEPPPVEGAPAVLEARVSDRPKLYRVESTILQQLPTDADGLRDRTLARIPIEFLETIYIQSRIDPDVRLVSELAEEGMRRWKIAINDKLHPANVSEVSALVAGVNEAAIIDFASDTGEDLVSFGLLPPARRIAFVMSVPGLSNEDGSPGAPQRFERILNLGWREGEEQRLFASFEGEPHVYELDPSFVNLVPTHPLKWRSLNVLSFHKLHVKSIVRDIPGQEKLRLEYDYRTDNWTATRNGVEVPTLDQAAARRLQERLGGLTAQGWYLSLASALQALQTPSAEFEIVTNEYDPAVGEARPKTYQLRLAESNIVIPPSNRPLYFGQLDGSNDVFFLDYETYGNLIRGVTTSRVVP